MAVFAPGESGRPTADLTELERALLADLAGQVRGLLGGPKEADPLAGVVGPAPERSDDPVLGRLLPDAYRGDEESATDFRRFTEAELRAGKVRDALAVVDSVQRPGPVVLDDDEAADTWLRALNDIRLALGARLDVDEQSWERMQALPAGDRERAWLEVYHWLGLLQETLLECLAS